MPTYEKKAKMNQQQLGRIERAVTQNPAQRIIKQAPPNADPRRRIVENKKQENKVTMTPTRRSPNYAEEVIRKVLNKK